MLFQVQKLGFMFITISYKEHLQLSHNAFAESSNLVVGTKLISWKASSSSKQANKMPIEHNFNEWNEQKALLNDQLNGNII